MAALSNPIMQIVAPAQGSPMQSMTMMMRVRWASMQRRERASVREHEHENANGIAALRGRLIEECALVAEVCAAPSRKETGVLRAWVETPAGDCRLIMNETVRCEQHGENGWRHMTLRRRDGSVVLTCSAREGELQYVRTTLLESAGLRAGQYEPPRLA